MERDVYEAGGVHKQPGTGAGLAPKLCPVHYTRKGAPLPRVCPRPTWRVALAHPQMVRGVDETVEGLGDRWAAPSSLAGGTRNNCSQRMRREAGWVARCQTAVFSRCAVAPGGGAGSFAACSTYLVRGPGLCSLCLSNKKYDSSQHNHSCPV